MQISTLHASSSSSSSSHSSTGSGPAQLSPAAQKLWAPHDPPPPPPHAAKASCGGVGAASHSEGPASGVAPPPPSWHAACRAEAVASRSHAVRRLGAVLNEIGQQHMRQSELSAAGRCFADGVHVFSNAGDVPNAALLLLNRAAIERQRAAWQAEAHSAVAAATSAAHELLRSSSDGRTAAEPPPPATEPSAPTEPHPPSKERPGPGGVERPSGGGSAVMLVGPRGREASLTLSPDTSLHPKLNPNPNPS